MLLIAQPLSTAVAKPAAGVPLIELQDLLKPYPNLQLEIRLQLLRAGLKREQVACASPRLGRDWKALANRSTAPYACPIGKRTLHLTATQHYYDAKGRVIDPRDRELVSRAQRLTETHVKWHWR